MASTVSYDGIAVTAAVDMLEIGCDGSHIKIVGWFIGQSTDLGDAAEEILRYGIVRGNTTLGSGGTAGVKVVLDPGANTLDSDTLATNNTTAASGGSPATLHRDTFNIRVGEKVWVPEGCEAKSGNDAATWALVVRLLAAPSDSLTMTGTFYLALY